MVSDHDTLLSYFSRQIAERAEFVAFRTKREGAWASTTWGQWNARSRAVALDLIEVGLQVGDRAAILANTREEWAVADIAILMAGAVTVPIYQTLAADQVDYVLTHSDAKVLFVEDVVFLKRLVDANVSQLDKLLRIVVLDGRDASEQLASFPASVRGKIVTLDAAIKAHKGASAASNAALEERTAGVKPETLAAIVYTSGTTGNPKGVMLTHSNFCHEVSAVAEVLAIVPADEQLLFLPMAHIFGKLLLAAQLKVGYVSAFAEAVPKVLDNAMELNPTIIGCVPRIYEKVFAVANDKAREAGGLKEVIFNWATDVGRQMARVRQAHGSPSLALQLQFAVADKLVLSKIRGRFGARLRIAVSGGAPLAKELCEWFHGAGMMVLEGYGLTETTGAATLNTPSNYKFGSVGGAVRGVEVKMAGDGEVMVRGPIVMKGYYQREQETRDVLDSDGWFSTGDIGVLAADGSVTITDRKKDIIVTAGGKNVSPQNIENLLKQSQWISQAMVHGDKRPYLVALVTLNPEAIERFCKSAGGEVDKEKIYAREEVIALVNAEIEKINGRLSKFETIKKIAIVPGDFTIDGGELTPTLKVKRKVVTERHLQLLDGLYR